MATATDAGNLSAEAVKNRASEAASNVADKAKQAASALGQKAEQTTHAMGSGMKSLSDTIRNKAPQEGMMGEAASSIAQGLESGGNYLEQAGIQGIAEDLTNLVRRNPVPALLVGVGLGFLLARATTRR
jgi:hypothetical protein